MPDHVASILLTLLFGSILAAPSLTANAAMSLPFQDSLASTTGWTVLKSEGNDLTVNEGRLSVAAGDDSYAHIQRPLETDLVTITARTPELASIYVVWDAGNWCGLGKISPTPFGRFYSTVTENAKTIETNHRGCVAWKPQFVRLQVGSDCVRFLYSEDGSEWIWLRTIIRPASFTGAPALVAFGKHYPKGTQPFADSTLLNPGSAQGPRYRGAVEDIRIEATPAKDLRITAAERKELSNTASDRVGEILLSREEDATFASVSKYYPPMKLPREIVGIPERMVQIGVDHLARLDASPWAPPIAWFEVGDPRKPLGEGKEPITHRLLDGYLPVDTVTTVRGGVKYELTVFGWAEGFSSDKDMFTYIRIKARAGKGGRLARQFALGYNSKEGQKRSDWEMLGTGETAEIHLRFKHPEPETAGLVSAKNFDDKQREVVAFWTQKLKPAERFQIPDKRVNEAYKAWLMYSHLNAAKLNGHLEVHDGSGFYASMFGQSVALHAMVMDMYAMPAYSERIIDTMLHYQSPEGLYFQDCGLQDHGALLMSIAKHYETTGDIAWLRSVAPKVVKACDWLVRQRAETPKDGVTKGLIKFRPYNDATEPAFNYFGNCQAAVGLEAAAEALSELGMTAEATKYAAEAARYRKDILISMEAAAFKDGDATILPLEPDTHRMEKLSYNQGGDYYGLTAASVLETGFLDPFDKRAYWLTDLMDARKGLVAGMCEFMEGIDHAYTYGYWMTQMQREDIKKVLLGFWGMFAYGMTRDTYSPVEVSNIKTGENHLTLPHTYSLSEQLRLLRNMMICEDGDTLWIGRAIPRDWLTPGKKLAADAAPTLFGPTSFSIASSADGTMRVKLAPPTRRARSRIFIRLRHPEFLNITEVQGADARFSGDTITLNNPTTPVELVVKFGGK